MPIYCCVPQCATTGTSGLHRFPADPQRRQEWIDKTKTLYLQPSRSARVCRKHFKNCDLLVDMDGKKKLTPNAIPSLFLPECLPGPSVLSWDHEYHAVGPTKKRRFKRLKMVKQEVSMSDENIGNEIEVDHVRRTDDSLEVGPYINIEYLRSLEEKILQQAKEKLELSQRLRNTTKQLKRLKEKQSNSKLDDQQVLEYLRKNKKYSSNQIEFQEMQLRNASKKPRGCRYTLKEKSMCLAMYKSGPRSYRFKESNKIMVLPSLSTLCRHSANMLFRVGVKPELLSFIKEKVKDWSESDLLCSFSFDETALKSRLEYSTTDDEIIGFIELAGIRKPVFATHALTFMVRGINRPFKQPVAHFYTHGLKAFELAELMLLVLEAVFSTGLNVIHSVCDQVIINESAIHRLMDRDFPRTPGCLLKFKVCGKVIIHSYDAPHLLKVVRNNLEVKDFVHCIGKRWGISNANIFGTKQIASWKDVERLYELDRTGSYRLLPKITDEHIKPKKLKMKVCVATQVFSQTYGNAMMEFAKTNKSNIANGTAQMLLFFNDVFDSINGSGPAELESLKGSINEHSVHFAFWEWALLMLQKMNFIDKTNGNINYRSTVLNKIESTIKDYRELTRICLNKNVEEVSLRNTNSDGLEIFFGCVKSCCQISCTMTPRQFSSGYTTMILNNLMNVKSASMNCEPDNTYGLLNDVHDLILNHINRVSTEAVGSPPNDFYADVVCDPQFTNRQLNFFELKSLTQVANVICFKILKNNYCNDCRQNLQVEHGMNDHAFPRFIEAFKKVFHFAHQLIPSVAVEKSLKKFVIEEMKNQFKEEAASNKITELSVIGCVDHNLEIVNKLLEFTVIYVIKIFCKNINSFLTGKTTELPSEHTDIQELAHTFWLKKKTRIGKYSDIFKT